MENLPDSHMTFHPRIPILLRSNQIINKPQHSKPIQSLPLAAHRNEPPNFPPNIPKFANIKIFSNIAQKDSESIAKFEE